MGSSQSQLQPRPPPIERKGTPPRPSASDLNEPRHPRQSFLSYFIPMSTPDLTHTHIPPTSGDIHQVTDILAARGLPPELVPRILDYAEFWSGCRRMSKKHLTVTFTSNHVGRDPTWSNDHEEELKVEREVEGSGLKNGNGEVWYLVSQPIGCMGSYDGPREEGLPEDTEWMDEKGKKVYDGEQEEERKGWLRRVVVETLSKDQGWSSFAQHYGTYEQSYSWFEISLLRHGKEVKDSRYSIQNNVHAGQYFKAHSNTLDWNHPLVKAAKPGDRVVLWVRAKYPGWRNNVQEAAITLFASPFPLD